MRNGQLLSLFLLGFLCNLCVASPPWPIDYWNHTRIVIIEEYRPAGYIDHPSPGPNFRPTDRPKDHSYYTGSSEAKVFEENDLHIRLYQEILATDSNRNIIFSPFSIQLCLALAHLGAHGATADEISRLIGYSSTFTSKNLSTVLRHLSEQDVLQVANKIYVKSGYELKPTYETSVRDDLKSDVDSIDFGQSVAAAKTINDWIEEQTNHRIKNVVKSDSLNSLTRLLLVNAVYFKASWKKQFSATTTKKFTNSDSSVSDAQMMHKTADFSVARVDILKSYIVKLDYHKTNIAMYLVIPDEINGLTKIEQNLDQLNFYDTFQNMTTTHVKLEVPKVDVEADIELIKVLKELGMVTAFSSAADFSNMLNERLKITDAIHKAFIKMDEKGTEAGAATVMQVSNRVHRPQIELELKADRPFMFAIVSEDYNIPLFMGAVKRL